MNIYGKEVRLKVRKGDGHKVRRTKRHASLKHDSRAKQKHSFRRELSSFQ